MIGVLGVVALLLGVAPPSASGADEEVLMRVQFEAARQFEPCSPYGCFGSLSSLAAPWVSPPPAGQEVCTVLDYNPSEQAGFLVSGMLKTSEHTWTSTHPSSEDDSDLNLRFCETGTGLPTQAASASGTATFTSGSGGGFISLDAYNSGNRFAMLPPEYPQTDAFTRTGTHYHTTLEVRAHLETYYWDPLWSADALAVEVDVTCGADYLCDVVMTRGF